MFWSRNKKKIKELAETVEELQATLTTLSGSVTDAICKTAGWLGALELRIRKFETIVIKECRHVLPQGTPVYYSGDKKHYYASGTCSKCGFHVDITVGDKFRINTPTSKKPSGPRNK